MRYLENVAQLSLDQSKCTGCGLCSVVCPHAVFTLKDRKSFITDHGACMECGACDLNCSNGAIKVESGTGCATAIIYASLTGKEVTCC